MRTRPARTGPGDRELLYGRNAVREALLANRRRFIRLTLAEGIEANERVDEIEQLASQRLVAIDRVPRAVIDNRVSGHHQGIVLEASGYVYVEEFDLTALAAAKGVILALDGVTDPQNLATLLRTAEATGVGLVVMPQDRSARVTPAVVNASAGAVEHLKIIQEVNLVRWLERAKKDGFWVVGMAGDEEAQPLFDTSMRPPVILVVGSEGEGLRRLVRDSCDLVVALPMAGQIGSLNAAVAGSIGLYEIMRDAEPLDQDDAI